MADINENLPAACEQALERQARLDAGAALPPEEREELTAHFAACASCRRLLDEFAHLEEQLRSAYAATRAAPAFAARAMSALPAAPGPQLAGGAPRVFAVARRRIFGRGVAVAAGLAASVVLVLAIVYGMLASTGGHAARIAIRKNGVRGANGQPVSELKVGEVYTVRETTVLSLADAGLLKLQPGAEFQLQPSAADAGPGVQLMSGDLYVWGEDDLKPVRVSASSFEATLQKGDFFVADEGEGIEVPAGVVIVFSGRAQVASENETRPLRAGQVFVSLGRDDWAVTQTLDLTEAVTHVAVSPVVGQQDAATLRREYAARVRGYQRELTALEQQAQNERNAQRQAELRERYRRVLAYRDAHQRRLDTLWQASPIDAIRRGLEGHTDDPTRWL